MFVSPLPNSLFEYSVPMATNQKYISDAVVQMDTNRPIAEHLKGITKEDDGKLNLHLKNVPNFDTIISAIGWSMDRTPLDPLNPDMMEVGGTHDRYPALDATYQSVNVPGLYFAGTLTHGNDKGRSAGGFIHGFRYTARALSRMLNATDEYPWPEVEVADRLFFPTMKAAGEAMAEAVMNRLGTSSGLYQMQSELQDVYAYYDGKLRRYEEVPKRYTSRLISQIPERAAVFTVTFQYNENFSDVKRDLFDNKRVAKNQLHPEMPGKLQYQVMPEGWSDMNFLHPVLEQIQYGFFGRDCTDLIGVKFHMAEDLETEWQRDIDRAALTEWFVVRNFVAPCQMGPTGHEANLVKQLWEKAAGIVRKKEVLPGSKEDRNWSTNAEKKQRDRGSLFTTMKSTGSSKKAGTTPQPKRVSVPKKPKMVIKDLQGRNTTKSEPKSETTTTTTTTTAATNPVTGIEPMTRNQLKGLKLPDNVKVYQINNSTNRITPSSSSSPPEVVVVIDNFFGNELAEIIHEELIANDDDWKPATGQHQKYFRGMEKSLTDDDLFNPPSNIRAGFPGLRKDLQPEYKEAVMDKLSELSLERIFDVVYEKLQYKLQPYSFYGNVCYEPSSLGLLQSAPHNDPDRFALLHYLSPTWEGTGGTAFYRETYSQASRFLKEDCIMYKERQTTGDVDHYSSYCDKNFQRDAFSARVKQGSYRSVTDEDFELLLAIPYQFDRAVIYMGNQLHSGYLTDNDVQQLSCRPTKGRLTANLSFN